MRQNLSSVLLVVGLVCVALANIVGIGTAIYEWGSVGLPLGPSIWEGFKIWIEMIIGGVIVASIGYAL